MSGQLSLPVGAHLGQDDGEWLEGSGRHEEPACWGTPQLTNAANLGTLLSPFGSQWPRPLSGNGHTYYTGLL